MDLDREIAAAAGVGVASLIETEGLDDFRSRESEALRSALDAVPAVIATGGGAVCLEANRRLMRDRAIVVWLTADVAVLVKRLAASHERRPLLGGDAETALRKLASEREPLYREVADVVVDVTSLDRVEVVDAIAAALEGCGESALPEQEDA